MVGGDLTTVRRAGYLLGSLKFARGEAREHEQRRDEQSRYQVFHVDPSDVFGP